MTGPATVLLADDEPLIRAQLAQTLQLAGLEVIPVASGVEALNAACAGAPTPDLVVLDAELPGLDGHEVARILHREAHPVRVLLITKPYRLEDVVRRTQALLEQSAA
ncbi:response regulator transcription factor [Streptomyces sp. NBC_01304]|uniref:response regulator transcription factor n=1 Tax=Streptomyces sp. NBC_01304 TaxID=2903818 RepID=UPI002E0DC819|nr:response regulator [Streptomyces sp. NBC_01304]